MRKKVSQSVSLVLITSVLASCNQEPKIDTKQQRVYMRADSTAPYTEVTNDYQQSRHGGMGASPLLWYMAFRHLGGGMGFSNNRLHPSSVYGNNTAKANAYSAQRGGFGKSATNKSSSSFGS